MYSPIVMFFFLCTVKTKYWRMFFFLYSRVSVSRNMRSVTDACSNTEQRTPEFFSQKVNSIFVASTVFIWTQFAKDCLEYLEYYLRYLKLCCLLYYTLIRFFFRVLELCTSLQSIVGYCINIKVCLFSFNSIKSKN